MARRPQNPSIPPKYRPQQGISLLNRQLIRLENEIIKLPHDAPEVTGWEQRTTTLLDDIFGQPNGNKHDNTVKFITTRSDLAPRMNVNPFGGSNLPDDSQQRFEQKMKKKGLLLRSYIEQLEDESALLGEQIAIMPQDASVRRPTGSTVFIGHGHSPMWRELKDFLQESLGLRCDEFNRESAAGVPTTQRLKAMMDEAMFAFLVLTAEDEHRDGSVHPRENVIHEVGLFQGKLGFERAIILREEGCAEFTNIVGLTQILFPKGTIKAAFEDVRKVLQREGVFGKSEAAERGAL